MLFAVGAPVSNSSGIWRPTAAAAEGPAAAAALPYRMICAKVCHDNGYQLNVEEQGAIVSTAIVVLHDDGHHLIYEQWHAVSGTAAIVLHDDGDHFLYVQRDISHSIIAAVVLQTVPTNVPTGRCPFYHSSSSPACPWLPFLQRATGSPRPF